ncbi:MAG: carboxymuconolactone decarboxylase family protein [Acidimicrobiales bacterium]
MARIEPLPIKQWPPEMREAMAAMLPPVLRHPRPVQEGRPKAMNTLGTFAHHPALARAFWTFNGHVLMATTLTERQRELLVLRVAALRKAGYEWAQHVFVGRDVGLDDEEIGRVAFGPDAPLWSELDAALIRAVDELIGDGAISDATWAVLAGELDAQQLLDVIFTVGSYEILAWMMRSFDLDLDDDIRELMAKQQPGSADG